MKGIVKALCPTRSAAGELDKRHIESSRNLDYSHGQHKRKSSRRPVLTLKHLNVLLESLTHEIDERPLDIALKKARPKSQYRQSKHVRPPHIDVPTAAVVIKVQIGECLTDDCSNPVEDAVLIFLSALKSAAGLLIWRTKTYRTMTGDYVVVAANTAICLATRRTLYWRASVGHSRRTLDCARHDQYRAEQGY